MTESMRREDVARRALDGDRDAVEQLVRDLQGDIYGLALRMLWNREDAEDATQEILVRATQLRAEGAQFEAGAAFHPKVVVDGRLITGHNPASSLRAALEVLSTLASR